MAKIKGKKPTREQIKLLEKGNFDPTAFLYQGEDSMSIDGSKCTSKNSPKQRCAKFVHRTSGNIVKIPF